MKKSLLLFVTTLALALLAGCSGEISADQIDADPGTGPVSQWVEQLVDQTELSERELLGLAVSDWINLGVSILLVVGGYLLGMVLVRRVFPPLLQRTFGAPGEKWLKVNGSDITWLIVVLVLGLATRRLNFIDDSLKDFLDGLYFFLLLLISFRIVWRLIGFVGAEYQEQAVVEGREAELAPVIVLIERLLRAVAIVAALAVGLAQLGVNIGVLLAGLGLAGLALSLAAQDTIGDGIAGFLILVDRPFRIGDRIEIEGAGTWGDVVEVGLRTTSIRTRDNRMVIVPNSIIGKNQVINYTFPDPRYRVETHVHVAYDTDIEEARRVIIKAVRKVDGVLPNKPVDALYIEMGQSAIVLRARWWIESYTDTRHIFDRVNSEVHNALAEAEIKIPYSTLDLNVNLDPNQLNPSSEEI
ncbi:MAG: mechanosensitive ion channel family protein [Chloroflexota bacterium]|nr:MAG: mechanosensitive ion channel family protein [Chloroflexota bacterium]